MVRFNDKEQVSTLASNDILPMTDISDSANDKKVTVNQLSKFTVDNISTLTGGLGFSQNNLTNTLKTNYDTAYNNLSTLGLLNEAGNQKLALSNMFPIGSIALSDSTGYAQVLAMKNSSTTTVTDTINGIPVTYTLATDGSKVADIGQKNNIDKIYALLGYSEYYIIDTTNRQFYLPRLENPLTDIVNARKSYLKINCYREQFLYAGSSHSAITIKEDTYLKFKMGGYTRVWYNENETTFDAKTKLDSGSAFSAGKQYYIYLVETAKVNKFDIIVSLNSTYPTGYNANNSYCIGGFHTLCVSVTASNAPALPANSLWDAHPAIGYNAGDIIPNSIWCETHRPMSSPAGMVYIDLLDLWVDIYLQSGTYKNTTSAYGATVTDSRTPIQHLWDMQLVGKRLARDVEFMIFAEGSNQKTNISGSAAPSPKTSGGHVDTAGKRMISGYFVEECCGYLWQWLDEIGFNGQGNWTGYGDEGTRGSTYGMPYILAAGGAWGGSSSCGSRSRACDGARSGVRAGRGGRGVSLPKFGR